MSFTVWARGSVEGKANHVLLEDRQTPRGRLRCTWLKNVTDDLTSSDMGLCEA